MRHFGVDVRCGFEAATYRFGTQMTAFAAIFHINLGGPVTPQARAAGRGAR